MTRQDEVGNVFYSGFKIKNLAAKVKWLKLVITALEPAPLHLELVGQYKHFTRRPSMAFGTDLRTVYK
jgi:hypothetical protein